MADVNSYSRKRTNPSVEVVIKLNGEDASDQQTANVENVDPKAKIARKSDLIEDSDSNLCHHDLSENSLEANVSIQEKILELQEENMNLKFQLQDINNKVCKCSLKMDKGIEDVPDGQNMAIMSIKFFNENAADLYKSKFQCFLESFAELAFKHEYLEIKVLRNNNIDCLIQADASPDKNKTKRKRKKSKTEAAKELFVLDTTPSLTTKGNGNLKYTSKYTVPIDIVDVKNEENHKETFLQTCFNCEGNHQLRDCQEPKDFAKINAARQKLKSQNMKVRYHLEDEQKYSHLLPGKLSESLKTALGVRNNQLPEYIYRMRVIGYPPGWMEEAQVIHSDISLYDIDGKNISCSKRNKQGNVDPDKVIEYIGFNVPIEKETKDDYERYKCPPYSEKCSKLAMLDFINKMEAKDKDNLETCDMDIDLPTDEEVVPPGCELIEENNQSLGRLSPSLLELEKKKLELLAALDDNVTNSSSGGDENTNNLGIIQQKVVLAKSDSQNEVLPQEFVASEKENANKLQAVEINDQQKEAEKENINREDSEIKPPEKISTPKASKDESETSSTEKRIASEPAELVGTHEDTLKIEEALQKSEPQMEEVVKTRSEDATLVDSSPRTPVDIVKKSSLGTPVLKSATPFTSLPSPEKFSKGVSPIINFENLPNATGKYEQMTNVLFKVRRTLKTTTDRS